MKYLQLVLLVTQVSLQMRAQCEVQNKVFPDQTMYYFMDPVVFFQTESNRLRGNLITDKENYFVQFMPEPFPARSENKKFKSPCVIHLASGQTYTLENYDYRYRRSDSTLALMFLLPKKQLSEFEDHDIVWVNLDVNDENGPRHYIFVMHKAVVREQLNCLRDK